MGKPAIIQVEDIRFGPDRYCLLLNDGKDKIYGEITNDDGKILKVTSKYYSIRDPEE